MIRRPDANLALIRRVLGNDYLELQLVQLRIEEDFEENGDEGEPEVAEEGSCRVTAVTVAPNGHHQKFEGKGCGMVGALFHGLRGHYAIEYQSLDSIQLVDFQVEGQLDTKSEQSGVDARATVKIAVENSEGKRFEFSDDSRSVVSSTARAVLAACEYFVNAERAFIMLYRSLNDARQRNRPDLIARYTSEMAEIVKSTSYGQVIENIKRELG